MKNDNESRVKNIKQTLLELLGLLEQYEQVSDNDFTLIISPNYEGKDFQEERKLYRKLEKIVINANPSMLSKHIISQRLIYGWLQKTLVFTKDKKSLLNQIDGEISQLINYKVCREIDIPILNLNVEDKPFRIGNVTFSPITESDRINANPLSWWGFVENKYSDMDAAFSFVSYARIIVSGDYIKSIEVAASTANEAILIIRAIGFPFSDEPIPEIGLISDHQIGIARPHRIREIEISARLEDDTEFSMYPVIETRPYELYSEILNNIEPKIIQRLIEIIDEDGFTPSNSMRRKFLGGLRWIGEATKPDILSARYLKLSTALEVLIGGEPGNDKYVTNRGITATLAERAAFLVGKTLEERKAVAKKINDHYGNRSLIVHGKDTSVSAKDLREFADLVRTVAWGLLSHLDKIITTDDFYKWQLIMRYGSASEGIENL